MNEKLIKLTNKKIFTNSEMLSFLKLFQDIVVDFNSKLPDGPVENPDDLLVRSSPASVLTTSLSTFKTNFFTLENAMELPRKFVETEEMITNNRNRLLTFGMIKKLVYGIYTKDKNNNNAQKLWFVIRIYNNISKLKLSAIHAKFLKFVADMESEDYKACCTSLKLTELISQLKELNLLFEQLLIKRSEYINKNYKSIQPYRLVCESDYLNIFNLISSIISLDPITDYSSFITKLNGYTYYYNNIAHIKLTRSKNKNKPSEEPDPLSDEPDMSV